MRKVGEYVIDSSFVKRCLHTDRVGSVLGDVESSHDVVFVFDDKEKFVGVLSLQQVLSKHHYPPKTLVSHALVKPMRLTPDTAISPALEYMVGSRMYTLPVLKDDVVEGVITAAEVLRNVTEDPALLELIEPYAQIHDPITVKHDESIKKVHAVFRDRKISRLIVTDKKGAVAGIIALSDVIPVYVQPDQQRTRTGTKPGGMSQIRLRQKTFDDEKALAENELVDRYMKKRVVTVPVGSSLKNMLDAMQQNEVHSVVVADDNRPVGFLSRYDVLKAYMVASMDESSVAS